MKINKLTIHNILSIEDAEIMFEDSGLVLVEGFDYDTGRANGAGKSSIFNALSFGLYDEVPRKITKSEILRKGCKEGYSQVDIQVGIDVYSVKRSRPVNNTFYKNGIEISITQQEFESIIGLNYDQFLITMYTAQDSSNKFIMLNDKDKKDFILKIMNLGNFSKYKKDITDELSKLQMDKALLSIKLDGFKQSISIHRGNIVDVITIQSKIDSDLLDVSSYISKINELSKITEPDVSRYNDIEQKIGDKILTLQTTKILCSQKRTELTKLRNQTPDTVCPDCNTDLNIINGHAHKAADKIKIEEQIKNVIIEINEFEKILSKEQELKDYINKLKLKKQEEYQEYRTAQSTLSEYKNILYAKQLGISNMTKDLNKNSLIKDQVSLIIKDAQEVQSKLKEISSEIEILSVIGTFFDPTGAPAYIMDSIVDAFNDAVIDYISMIWPNASYSLQTFKENKDKTIAAKFSESLLINGKDRSIGSLSGGELRALSLALDFAIIDVLHSQFSLSLNPIVLDEPFNGLDSVGRELVIDLLEKFAETRQVFIVDHAAEAKAMFSHIIRVEKRSGISIIA